MMKARTFLVAEWVGIGALTLVALRVMPTQEFVSDFLLLALIGFAGGMVARHSSAVTGAVMGTILSLPVGLATGTFLFLGENWQIWTAVAIVLVATGFMFARWLRSRWRPSST